MDGGGFKAMDSGDYMTLTLTVIGGGGGGVWREREFTLTQWSRT